MAETIQSAQRREDDYFKCTHGNCDKTFLCRKNLEAHIRAKHSTDESSRHRCKLCEKTFAYRPGLTRHIRFAHDERIVHCTEDGCGKTFLTYESRREHFLLQHSTSEVDKYPRDRLKCDQEGCELSFATVQALQLHTQMKHCETKPSRHLCAICGKAYLYQWDLTRHMRDSHDNVGPYKCGFQGCQKKYATNARLKTHIRTKHTKSKYCCTLCEVSYLYKGHLERHMETAHGKKNVGDTGNDSKQRRVFTSATDAEKENGKMTQISPERQLSDYLVHVEFPKRNISLGNLKKEFYLKTLQACQEARYDGDSSPDFKDIISLHGKFILRLENPDHQGFFTKVMESLGV